MPQHGIESTAADWDSGIMTLTRIQVQGILGALCYHIGHIYGVVGFKSFYEGVISHLDTLQGASAWHREHCC